VRQIGCRSCSVLRAIGNSRCRARDSPSTEPARVWWRSRRSKTSRAKVMGEVERGQPRATEHRVAVLGKMASARLLDLEQSRDDGTDGAPSGPAHRKLWAFTKEPRRVFETDAVIESRK
jgi:hypothetical protein